MWAILQPCRWSQENIKHRMSATPASSFHMCIEAHSHDVKHVWKQDFTFPDSLSLALWLYSDNLGRELSATVAVLCEKSVRAVARTSLMVTYYNNISNSNYITSTNQALKSKNMKPQNYWVPGLCLSSGILNTRKDNSGRCTKSWNTVNLGSI
jgi:hypothetical protein